VWQEAWRSAEFVFGESADLAVAILVFGHQLCGRQRRILAFRQAIFPPHSADRDNGDRLGAGISRRYGQSQMM
jgi:hypothetical protein